MSKLCIDDKFAWNHLAVFGKLFQLFPNPVGKKNLIYEQVFLTNFRCPFKYFTPEILERLSYNAAPRYFSRFLFCFCFFSLLFFFLLQVLLSLEYRWSLDINYLLPLFPCECFLDLIQEGFVDILVLLVSFQPKLSSHDAAARPSNSSYKKSRKLIPICAGNSPLRERSQGVFL